MCVYWFFLESESKEVAPYRRGRGRRCHRRCHRHCFVCRFEYGFGKVSGDTDIKHGDPISNILLDNLGSFTVSTLVGVDRVIRCNDARHSFFFFNQV